MPYGNSLAAPPADHRWFLFRAAAPSKRQLEMGGNTKNQDQLPGTRRSGKQVPSPIGNREFLIYICFEARNI
jgi:hypothetical protein